MSPPIIGRLVTFLVKNSGRCLHS